MCKLAQKWGRNGKVWSGGKRSLHRVRVCSTRGLGGARCWTASRNICLSPPIAEEAAPKRGNDSSSRHEPTAPRATAEANPKRPSGSSGDENPGRRGAGRPPEQQSHSVVRQSGGGAGKGGGWVSWSSRQVGLAVGPGREEVQGGTRGVGGRRCWSSPSLTPAPVSASQKSVSYGRPASRRKGPRSQQL